MIPACKTGGIDGRIVRINAVVYCPDVNPLETIFI